MVGPLPSMVLGLGSVTASVSSKSYQALQGRKMYVL